MFKVFIVDDEDFIREGLKTIIDWREYGFIVCGEAVDGLEALEKIRKLKPDLILLDVIMPRMDGLQLIKQLNKEKIFCKTIVISGYSEFEYARKALNYGVKAYILKPVNEEELAEKVKSIYKEIFEGYTKDKYVRANTEIAANKIMENLLSGNVDYAQIEEYVSILDYSLPWNTYQLILMNVDSLTISERIDLEKTIRNWVQMGWKGIAFSLGNYMGVMVKDLAFDIERSAGLETLCNMIINKVGKRILIAVGKPEITLEAIPGAFEHLKKLADNTFLYGSTKYVFLKQNETAKADLKKVYTEKIIDKLFNAINSDDEERIEILLQQFYRHFEDLQFSERRIKFEYVKLYLSLANKLCLENIEQDLMSVEEVVDNINEMPTLKKLHCFFKHRLLLLSKTLANKKSEDTIIKIIRFIRQNYANREISIKMLASLYGYNPTYLGALFKKYTGMSFNNYLEMIRIDNAKRLLSEGFKVNQVAGMVGYNDYAYFYKKFKKNTGKSPINFAHKAVKLRSENC